MPWLGLDRRLGVEVGLLVTLSRFCVEGSCYCTGCLRCVVCVCVDLFRFGGPHCGGHSDSGGEDQQHR